MDEGWDGTMRRKSTSIMIDSNQHRPAKPVKFGESRLRPPHRVSELCAFAVNARATRGGLVGEWRLVIGPFGAAGSDVQESRLEGQRRQPCKHVPGKILGAIGRCLQG